MAVADFSYADYLLFAGATDVNHSLFSTVASGVLGTLNNVYHIYPEVSEITVNLFLTSKVFELPAEPVNSITSLTYDSSVIDPSQYTWYGRDVVLATPITDYRKPVIAVLQVGYEVLPADLKLAIYRHIDAVIFALQKSVDGITKTANSTGNTTFFRNVAIPAPVRTVYDFYSPRQTILA